MGWLVSGDPAKSTDAQSPPSLAKTTTSPALVSTGTLGSAAAVESQVHLPPVKVSTGNRTSGFAWWVGGENSKSFLGLEKKTPGNAVEARDAMASSSRPNEGVFGFNFGNTKPSALISRKSVYLASSQPNPAKPYFHDFAAYSRGLLTNTASGGWRKDLSLLVRIRTRQLAGCTCCQRFDFPIYQTQLGQQAP